jgi:hypothetical protein
MGARSAIPSESARRRGARPGAEFPSPDRTSGSGITGPRRRHLSWTTGSDGSSTAELRERHERGCRAEERTRPLKNGTADHTERGKAHTTAVEEG